ncbi:hypothetical protein ABV409_08195 [Flagellimonas sp. DF-77]|uniref:hypothetical protein n=1 Tax=Flagellimonas algarum TaxID=3230298 RepID=UPI00339952D6
MKHVTILSICLFFFSGIRGNVPAVQAQSECFALAMEGKDTQALVSMFIEESILLPEYAPMLQGQARIRGYFEDLFLATETVHFEKHPFEIQQYDTYVVELGTYKHRYKTVNETPIDYDGKYLTFWRMEGDTPIIIAHIWGASKYMEATQLVFEKPVSESPSFEIKPTEWSRAIEYIRLKAYDAVLKGNANKQTEPYADDAVYMTYYDPPYIGKTRILDYYRDHYDPSVTRDSLMTKAVRIIELDSHALKFGEYYVEWTYENEAYYIRGKGLSVFRKRADGQVEIYRQMINHSMPPKSKNP